MRNNLSKAFKFGRKSLPILFSKQSKRQISISVFLRAEAKPAAASDKKMFCFQCEQTKEGTGCTTIGVCGKTPEVAKLQDLLIHSTKAISMYATRARSVGIKNAELDAWLPSAIFSTLTNVNFSRRDSRKNI
eukprot:TRINITY_DN924_c0_g1_i1.p1 TRINITY_DN924_c0_g1~~TRINITY_DN924_c0_g1_i1.p1  ORF type:complete len:151 (+),score=17.27 TRINITY_DN924_c0_g1_i1:58-453(+)